MTLDISHLRLRAQQVERPVFKTAREVVSYLGAIQAQDYAMGKWALGTRMAHATTDALIEDALNNGQIIRTHVMRPTWHFVAPEDLHWMLELTAPNVIRMMGSNNRLLGLDDKALEKGNNTIRDVLSGSRHVTRDEILEALRHAGLKTHENRSSHFLMHAEMSGIICNGKRKGKQHTYTLLDKWVKKEKHFSRDEALAELAKRYFSSHGPATLKDFAWWSGLSVMDSKAAVALNEKFLVAEKLASETYYISREVKRDANSTASVHLLPAFDEFLIAYKDRSASINQDFTKHTFTNNGIFKPIIVVNGQVIGTWKRTTIKDKLHIEAHLLQRTSKSLHKEIAKEAKHYGNFMEKKIELIIQEQPKL